MSFKSLDRLGKARKRFDGVAIFAESSPLIEPEPTDPTTSTRAAPRLDDQSVISCGFVHSPRRIRLNPIFGFSPDSIRSRIDSGRVFVTIEFSYRVQPREDRRVTSRLLLTPAVGVLLLLSGCGTIWDAPVGYSESPKLTGGELKGKTKLQKAVRAQLDKLYGPNPRDIRVFPGSGLFNGGTSLANLVKEGKKVREVKYEVVDSITGKKSIKTQHGGYSLYRRHCLHCHGVSGDGAGPTAPYLYPRPRDYRPGIFKFTSTGLNKPTRDDLRKTLLYGIAGTSMPAFDAMLSADEIDQVVEYVVFLSMRGETELGLIDIASTVDEKDAATELSDEVGLDTAKVVANKWVQASNLVVDPPIPRVIADEASVKRGRELYLGLNKTGGKVECVACHGPQAHGDGPSFVDKTVFDKVVFWEKSIDEAIDEIYEHMIFEHEGKVEAAKNPKDVPPLIAKKEFAAKVKKAWGESLDDWQNPLRPANLTLGRYKGGRRPIDLYWRIANGINGAKMPGHASAIKPEQIWDLVNFVIQLPYDPNMLENAPPPPAAAVAER